MTIWNSEVLPTFQNSHLVLLDSNTDEINKDDSRNAIAKLQRVVKTVNAFIDVDKCIEYINRFKQRLFLMMLSAELLEMVVPIIQAMPQVTSVYIFCKNRTWCEKQTKQWSKVKGMFINIPAVCEALQGAVLKVDYNSASTDFVEETNDVPKKNLDILGSSFMYTQILKEIFLTIDFQQVHINEFLTYCRKQFLANAIQLRNIDLIEKEYHDHNPIWWYTYDCFLSSMVNRALRAMEVDLIIGMGFFLKDLHNHIVRLHVEQFGDQHHSKTFIVYCGQDLSETDFENLKEAQGGLLSFNNFLSTYPDRAVAFIHAESNQCDPDLISVLFEITVNSSTSSSPFANIKHVSYYPEEEEVLFSMHSVFRATQIKQIEGNNRLWQVNLTLTNDNDPQLHLLTEHIRKETFPHRNGWYRLANFLIKLGQIDKTQQICDMMLDETNDENKKADIYHMLGIVNDRNGNYANAVEYYEKAIKINQQILPSTYNDTTASYVNLSSVYKNMEEYSKALMFYRTALEIYQKTLPTNHPDLAITYNNIGTVYDSVREYSEALSYHEKALEIKQKTLPPNHPHLAHSYNNIGVVYDNMGENSTARLCYERAVEIYTKTLFEYHPDVVPFFNNIGKMLYHEGVDAEKCLQYEEALEVFQKILPAKHPHLAVSYNNIGAMYDSVGEYSKALLYHEKALELKQKILSSNHPMLANSYNNIGRVYYNKGEYSKALSYYERALNIFQRSLPSGHPNIKTVIDNVEIVKKKL